MWSFNQDLMDIAIGIEWFTVNQCRWNGSFEVEQWRETG
jgi:hypothetical protein